MTAILDELRRLDEAHARGDISAAERAAAKAQLMDAIPDVTPDCPPDDPDCRATDKPPSRLVPLLTLCAFILAICAGTALVLTRDILLSATLAITVLAAFTVMLFREIDG